MVALDMVEAGARLRAADPQQVAALAASIAEVGLLSPITVYARPVIRCGIETPGWGIVAGLHRLEACRSLGMTEIEVSVTDLPELKRQIAECDENLCGTKLSQAQRAMFTARRKQAYEALYPETRHGTNQHESSRQNGDCSSRFTAETAARTGKSERAVQRDATRGARIDADVLADVVGTEMDNGRTLDALAAVPRDAQKAEIARIRESPRVKPVPTPLNDVETEDQWRGAMMRLWNRAPDAWREGFLDYVQTPVFDGTRAGAVG